MSVEGSSQRAITRAERVDQLLGGERGDVLSALDLVHGALASGYEFGREHLHLQLLRGAALGMNYANKFAFSARGMSKILCAHGLAF